MPTSNPTLGNSLLDCFPDLAAEWHPYKNGKANPSDFKSRSNKKVWWQCPIAPDHEWEAQICGRTRKDGRGCPCCKGLKIIESNCLSTLKPEIAAGWHPTKNQGLLPNTVAPCSRKKVWWQCPIAADHEWQAVISDVVYSCSNACPFCKGRRVAGSNCLTVLRPDIASEWHPTRNQGLTPDQFRHGSKHKAWWLCKNDESHIWLAAINNRTNKLTGCPFCRESKGERAVAKYLIDKNLSFDRQYRFSNCKNKRLLPFDFFVDFSHFKGVIEFHGIQHYKPVDRFGGTKSFEERKELDLIKKEFCRVQDIPFLVISYEEIKDVPNLISSFVRECG